jgi:lipopolysaccharide export system permease protein
MKLIERYIFRQLLGPTIFATTALAGVALLSQGLNLLDLIVEQRQTALVFLRVIMLGLPQLFALILPIAVFVAALVALNRLHTEQEIVVCFASGMSRWRVIAPAVRLAAIAALLTLAVNLFVQPWAQREVRETLFTVRNDLAATLVREGEFNKAAPGLTVYAQRVDQDGQMKNVFIQRRKANGDSETITAKEAVIARRAEGPALILRDGSSQEFSPKGVLNALTFKEQTFDLAPYVKTDERLFYKIGDRYMHELVFPDLRHDFERNNRSKMLAEAHFRLSGPLYVFTFMGLALAAVIGGPFSRLGYGRRIAAYAGEDVPLLNVLQYAIPLGGAWWGYGQLFKQSVVQEIGGRASRADNLTPIGATA